MASSSLRSSRQLLLRPLVRDLMTATRTARASLEQQAAEREFLLGVECAADDFLRPELADVKASDWLDRETVAFREGYLSTVAELGIAVSGARPPSRLLVPTFRRTAKRA